LKEEVRANVGQGCSILVTLVQGTNVVDQEKKKVTISWPLLPCESWNLSELVVLEKQL